MTAAADNETELLELALTGTAAHVEKLVRAWRRVDRIEAMAAGDRMILRSRKFVNPSPSMMEVY